MPRKVIDHDFTIEWLLISILSTTSRRNAYSIQLDWLTLIEDMLENQSLLPARVVVCPVLLNKGMSFGEFD